MAFAAKQKPACPVCQQADQVKSMQAAYDSGVARCAPPEVPTRNVFMMPFMIPSGVVVGICIFLVLVLIGSGLPMGGLLPVLVVLTLVAIIVALVVSYLAFQRIVAGDNEAAEQYPAWENAMEKWNQLAYCSRDDVVFNVEKSAVVPDKELQQLRTVSPAQGNVRTAIARH
jgi:hypothetical protein